MTKKVLIAIQSDKDDFALKYAKNYILSPNDQIILVNIRSEGVPLSLQRRDLIPEYHKKQELSIQESNELLQNSMKILNQENVILVSKSGPINSTLIDEIDYHKPELIVIGSRGLGKIEKFVLGSTSDYVLRNTKYPVLIARNPDTVQY